MSNWQHRAVLQQWADHALGRPDREARWLACGSATNFKGANAGGRDWADLEGDARDGRHEAYHRVELAIASIPLRARDRRAFRRALLGVLLGAAATPEGLGVVGPYRRAWKRIAPQFYVCVAIMESRL